MSLTLEDRFENWIALCRGVQDRELLDMAWQPVKGWRDLLGPDKASACLDAYNTAIVRLSARGRP